MVSLDDIRDHVASLFIMLNKHTVILFRIEFLVVLVTLFFFAMFVMDFYRRIIHNSFMRAIFSVFDAVSDSIVVYLLGAMQSAPFNNQLFPVWALVLVNLRHSADYISGYGVPDRRGRRFTEVRNVVKLLGSAFLNWTRGSSFVGTLWVLWILQILRCEYRFLSHILASRALWHGRSSELVAEHMRGMHEDDDQIMSSIREECDPVTMKGYRYLVYGETKQQKGVLKLGVGGFKLKKPQYALCLCTDQDQQQDASKNTSSTRNSRPRKTREATNNNKWWCYNSARPQEKKRTKKKKPPPPLITLDKVWDCTCTPIHQQGKFLKDLPLAFALSRLLRCRLEDVALQRCIFDTNRDLVKSIVGEKVGASDALRIMELQLAFVHDYFNTRYPMVFWCGLPSLLLSLLLSVLTMGAVVWLGVDIRKAYKPASGELANLVKGRNVDMIITWVFLGLMIVKEMWEILTYLRSDWTSLIKACEYVQRRCDRSKESKDTWMYCVLQYISRSKITGRRWHGFIDQYVFVESYDDRPRFWNLIHNLTTGIVAKKDDGAKLSTPVEVTDYVRQAVLEKLRKLLVDDGYGPQAGCRLPEFIKTLSNSNLSEELQSYQAYTTQPSSSSTPSTSTSTGIVLPTSSHVILVWHIATSLCEMELATEHGVDLGNPGFPCSLLSWFSSFCSSKPYLMDVDDKKGCSSSSSSSSRSLSWFANYCCSSKSNDNTEESKKVPKNLRETYMIANSLSRYCAYLLVSKPDLIPDSFLVPKIVFKKTVASARCGILKGCASLEERYRALKDEAKKPIKDSEREDVLKQGVALGKELLKHQGRWEILAGVWTELLIHTAPTWNAQAHRKCLSSGEFITHIWSLLWHYGIQKSSLWPEDIGPGNSDPQPQSDGTAGVDRRQTGGDMREIDIEHIGINIDQTNDDKGTKELEAAAGDSSTGVGQLRMEGTGSLEIVEEISEDEIVHITNVMSSPESHASWLGKSETSGSELNKVEEIVPDISTAK
ncbi:hypothetical protein BDA96_08G048100 [Sorghum bicolor]|uniref:DUF4220 domain-containing protein n=1 Tax=Sorghum bicolor TaxID=4558 RepID=A0A921QDN0_SORBI|nr:hypothetical protein BDA96_08G048100 [Sorghum bicolor]